MRKLRLVFGVLIVMFLLGIGSVSAQEKSTVLLKVKILGESAYVINTVKSDYTTYELKSKSKEDNALVALKKELDKWILEGYVVINSITSSSSGSPFSTNEIIYFLVKEVE